MVAEAPVTIVLTAKYEKTTRRYGDRGRNLQAEGLGLGTVMVGAFKEQDVENVLRIKRETPVYMMPVGKPR